MLIVPHLVATTVLTQTDSEDTYPRGKGTSVQISILASSVKETDRLACHPTEPFRQITIKSATELIRRTQGKETSDRETLVQATLAPATLVRVTLDKETLARATLARGILDKDKETSDQVNIIRPESEQEVKPNSAATYPADNIFMIFFLVGQNRFPYNPYGNNAANGILVGPGGPTGHYGRYGLDQGLYNRPPFGANGPYPGGPGGPGFGNRPYGYGSPYNEIIPFNSKAGSGILADETTNADSKSKKDNVKRKSN